MAVGIGVSLFFFLENETEVAALCSMIFLIGLGKLVVYLVERKNNKKEENEENEEKQEETQTLAANDDNAFKD